MGNRDKALSRTTLGGYAIGSLGTGGFATLPGLLLVFYLTDTLGVTALAAGVLVGGAKLWDMLIDPVIGLLSDRQLARHGSRRGFMVTGALLLPLFFVLTFAVPAGLAPQWAGLWVTLAFLAAATAFSLFQVPYITLPAELTTHYDARTELLTWRVVVLSIAILAFGAGGSALRMLGGDDPHRGYLIMALVCGVAIGIGMLLSSFVAPTGTPAPRAPATRTGSLRAHYAAGARVLRESQPLRALLLAYLLQAVASGAMLAAANYVAVWVLGSPAAVSWLFAALIGPALVATPMWGALARRLGKERGFLLASLLYALAALALLGLISQPGPWMYAAVGVCGAAYGGMQALPMAMLPDVIAHDAARHGQDRAGVCGGLWTAAETAGFALGAMALALVLAGSDYLVHAGTATIVQSDRSINAIVLAFSALPAALVLASLLPLARYRLRKGDIDV